MLILLALTAFAADYHVAQGGDDDDDGSSLYPWETLQHAADSVQAGDTVTVRPGTYSGFYLDASGTSGMPIPSRRSICS